MVIVGVYGGGCRCCIGNSDHAMLFSGSAVAVKSQALYWCNLWYCVALPLPISHYFTTMESGDIPKLQFTSRAIKFLHPPRREFDFLFGTLRFQISVWPIEHCRIH